MKKTITGMLLLMLSLVFVPTSAMAGHESAEAKQCSLGQKECGGKGCAHKSGEKCDETKCPIAGKIMKKSKFFLANQKEIGLSEDQVAKIKAIQMETKKAAIRMEAEMQVFELDMNVKLSEPKVDVEGLSAMIDQAVAGWSQGAKTSIADYAKLKAILSDAQMAKAKEIWARDDKE